MSVEEHTDEERRHKTMIEEAANGAGMTVEEWDRDSDNGDRVRAWFGNYRALEDDEENGIYEGCEGPVSAIVVGGVEYDNEHVSFGLHEEGCDGPWTVTDPMGLEPA